MLCALSQILAASSQAQVLDDPALTVEVVTLGLPAPTTMAFVAPDDILVLEKIGTVRRVQNGVLQPTPVLTLPVNARPSAARSASRWTHPRTDVVIFYPGSIYRIRGDPLPPEVPSLPVWGALVLLVLLGTGGALFTRMRRASGAPGPL